MVTVSCVIRSRQDNLNQIRFVAANDITHLEMYPAWMSTFPKAMAFVALFVSKNCKDTYNHAACLPNAKFDSCKRLVHWNTTDSILKLNFPTQRLATKAKSVAVVLSEVARVRQHVSWLGGGDLLPHALRFIFVRRMGSGIG